MVYDAFTVCSGLTQAALLLLCSWETMQDQLPGLLAKPGHRDGALCAACIMRILGNQAAEQAMGASC